MEAAAIFQLFSKIKKKMNVYQLVAIIFQKHALINGLAKELRWNSKFVCTVYIQQALMVSFLQALILLKIHDK
jgi:hypothetical protein